MWARTQPIATAVRSPKLHVHVNGAVPPVIKDAKVVLPTRVIVGWKSTEVIPGATFNKKAVVRITPPVDVPVIVTITPETTGAVEAAVNVKVEVAAGLEGVTGFGVNADAVTPVGRPLMDRVTA